MQEIITALTNGYYEKLNAIEKIEFFEKYLNMEEKTIKDAFVSGDIINEKKSRFDYDPDDCNYKNSDEYYNYKFGNTELL